MKRWIGTICSVLAFGAQGSLLEDGFETNAVGSSPNGVNGWTVANPSSSQKITVVSSPSPFSGGGHSVYYDDSDSTSTLSNLGLGHPLDAITSGIFSFDFNIDAGQWNAPSFFIYDSSGNVGVYIRLDTSSHEMQAVSSGGTTTLGAISRDTWYHVDITVGDVSGSSDAFDILVKNSSGSTIINQTGLAFKADIDSMSKIMFQTYTAAGSSGTQFYLDNVQVVPEPGTLSLVVFSATGLLLLMHRKIYSKQ